MLKFIGSGSCFNVTLGNNSAYIKEDDNLLLIDCGGDVFSKIVKKNILKDVNDITVLITHLHSDHIGSLADLIFYCYYKKNVKVSIAHPDDRIVKLLYIMGVVNDYYWFEKFSRDPCCYRLFLRDCFITPYNVDHDKNLSSSYGYEIRFKERSFYYSGDAKEIPKEILKELNNNKIDKIYQDVTSLDYDGNVHLSFRELCELIDPKFRNKVYCMHLDDSFDYMKAQELGFNVVKNN